MFETTGEVYFQPNELIVSKTDVSGRITYANDVFAKVAGYQIHELLGKPHNLIRHEFMPRSVFYLLWETLKAKQEIFAYVVNKTRTGGHYWVYAHVTPSLNEAGEIVGLHSSRRVPNREVIETQIVPLYEQLNKIEQAAETRKEGIESAVAFLMDFLAQNNTDYHRFILTLDRSAGDHAA